MANRQLTSKELIDFAIPLLTTVRKRLREISSRNKNLLWALRRKIYKELMYDERGKPMHRKQLKMKKRLAQKNCCALCKRKLADKGSILDRLKAMKGYTVENTRLLCQKCDTKIQVQKGYK